MTLPVNYWNIPALSDAEIQKLTAESFEELRRLESTLARQALSTYCGPIGGKTKLMMRTVAEIAAVDQICMLIATVRMDRESKRHDHR